ncbi:hypothetical protein DYB36_012311 [Aphanomyces astaci]|uniref:Apple domain-containing protein n=1 Tax=Aphanomyces astaci TaxID=112090 RepID=A0A397BNB4_APHAT|nr:hypothetical protein DYB36_012311 [Aphanomyces astaci]
MTRSSHSRIDSTMKIAVVLSVVAVAVATQDKIWPSVFRSLERTSTASVAVTVDDLNVQKDPTVFDWAKCNGLENELVLLCNDLIKEEIKSLAALPGVQKITTIADSSAKCRPKITSKPITTEATPTTTEATPTTTEATPTTTEATPTTTEAAPTTTEAAPTTTEASPTTTEATPTSTEAAPITTEATPTTTEAAPTTTEAAPTTTEATPTTTEATPTTTEATSTLSVCEKPVDGVDYYGHDIKFTQRSNSDDCCADCDNTPGCVVYVWTPWNDGTCFLKWHVGKSAPYWGAKAAKVTKSVGSCQAAQANVDYYGNDIARISGDKDDCCGLCLTADNCVGYSHYQGHCYLKGELGNPSAKEGATSGIRN